MGSTPFLSKEQAFTVRETCGTPVYVYDEGTLEASAAAVLAFPNAFGLTARFAMKALPTAAILRLFDRMGLYMDAGSGYEAERAMRAGIVPEHIQITSQDLPWNLKELVEKGCLF
ncbi:MAG TPA: diaminopimelate decarboxylase, partial [Candidatus Hydrogenedentes bacterium]|nr:diaminopimelate decarboxylase [Candidatus Hydrogenedentota bacterium]